MTDSVNSTSDGAPLDARHIVCPHCDAVNRVPLARLAQADGALGAGSGKYKAGRSR